MPPAALDSEALYEGWISDIDDWGKARDCQLHQIAEWMAGVGFAIPAGAARPDYCVAP